MSEDRILAALTQAPVCLALIDKSTAYLYVSNTYASRHYSSPEQMLGRKMKEFMEPKAYERHVKPKVIECLSGKNVGYQLERSVDGSDLIMAIRYMACYDREGEVWGFVNAAFDITSNCRSIGSPANTYAYRGDSELGFKGSTYIDFDEIQSQLTQKERLQTLGSSVAMLNHEIRNPLGTLSASLQLLEKQLPNDPQTQRIFDRCKRALVRCEHVSSSIIDYSKSIPVNLQLSNFDQWLTKLLQDYIVPQPIKVIWQPSSNKEVYLDEEFMHRAVSNLLDNAVHAMLEEDKSHDQQLSLQSHTYKGHIELTIIDTGPGIPIELHGEHPPAMAHSGSVTTGFGIMIARQIIERHKGRLTLQNNAKSGGKACISLPFI